jgi:replicative DNA helicase
MIEDILEQEALLIGSLMQNSERIDICDLTPDDFSSAEHRQYMECINECAAQQNLNPFAVKESFINETGVRDNLLLDYATRGLHVTEYQFKQYAERIKKESLKNKALSITSELIENLNTGKTDYIGAAISKLMNIDKSGAKYDHSFGEVADVALASLERIYSGKSDSIKTGFKDIDNCIGGWHNSDLIIIPARPAMGKDQPLYSKVLLSDGNFKAMGDISIGDDLASVDGKRSRVTAIYPQGKKKIYKLTLKDGREVECGAGHLWRVKSSRFKEDRTLTTIELINLISKVRYKDRVQLVGHNGDFGVDSSLINPWILGAMLGDGSLSSGFGFTNSEPDLLEKMEALLGENFTLSSSGCYDYNVKQINKKGNDLKDLFAELGLIGKKSCEKFIPKICFTQSKEFRCQLIAGLLETDGWVEKTGSINFSSSSKELAIGLKSLVESVGGSARYRVKTNVKYKYKGEVKNGLDAHILSIALPNHAMRFTTKRITKNIKERSVSVEPSITSIVECGEAETQCITVSHESSLYLTDNYCVTHNTAFMVNSFLKCDAKVGVISGEQGHEQIGVRSICIDGGISHQNFRRAQLNDDEFARLDKAANEFKLANGRIYDKPAPTILDVEKIARQWVHKRGVQILFIDYAQRLDHENKKLSRLDKMSDIAMRLKELARTLNIPVIALAQVNRNCEQRPDKRPMMSDIADASAFEKEADIIFTLYRDEVYNEDTTDKGIIEANFEKNRHGSTGRVKLSWKGQTMQVGDFTGYEQSCELKDDYVAYQSDGFLPQ